ncbi:nucleotidyltransferase family protein [Fulvivirga lutea]|uniref:Nucleotidyltransferase family protein n=1 Tax=Fulvivirga lutea TaxID=2810512 RepID=A0A974WGL4_9BACT|nr:nucleotidyltransferase family protein [Fulvivirga lutea]QSE96817.1 nucleotidyltransferase family protein [Fulvivirga lutea]
MRNFNDHLILKGSQIREALTRLNTLAMDAILFVVDDQKRLIGSLTDGDVRRGFLKNLSTEDKVEDFIQANPKYVNKNNYSLEQIIDLRENDFRIIPVLNGEHEVVNIINFRFLQSYLPLDAVVMAGGKGSRLKPLTDSVPKPLLKIGNKPIMEYCIERLSKFGVDDFWISLGYLGEQLEEYFGDGKNRGIDIRYIKEDKPLGTIGAVSKIKEFEHDYVLVTNSDILTAIDYEDFFLYFMEQDADMAIATIPYSIDVPYAVLETSDNKIISFSEKPTYTFYSNGGIYLIKAELLKKIPIDTFYNSTDFMQKLLQEGYKVISYPMRQYWLDIGKPKDFEKAQADIKHLNL